MDVPADWHSDLATSGGILPRILRESFSIITIEYTEFPWGDLAQAKSGAPKRASSGSCRQGTEGLGCGKTTRLHEAAQGLRERGSSPRTRVVTP